MRSIRSVSLIVNIIYLALTIYAWMIVARAVLSWLHLRPGSALFGLDRVLFQATEPYVALFRRLLPTARLGAVGIDLSSVVALVVLLVAMQIVARL
jgi:YggT family protein